MSAIQDMFQQGQLAEAAYAKLWDTALNKPITATDDVKTALIDEGMSIAQAAEFLKNWRVVDHIPDTYKGFSATIFERLDANGNGTGELSLAIRGSTQIVDFIADAGLIAADGIAADQLVDMYNYWQRLNAPAGTIYDAAVLMPIASFQVQNYSADKLIYDSVGDTYSTVKFVKSNTLPDATQVADPFPRVQARELETR